MQTIVEGTAAALILEFWGARPGAQPALNPSASEPARYRVHGTWTWDGL